MPTTRDRYPDSRLLSLRRAVRVTPRGLVEEYLAGYERLTLWSELRGVRWLRHRVAEVRTANGRTIRLPEGLPDIEALVDAIECEAQQVQAAWRERGVPASQVAEWLGITTTGRWMHDPNPGLVAAGGVLVAAAIVFIVIVPAMALPLLFWLVVGVAMLAAGALAGQPVITADVRGIVWRQGQRQWSLLWRDLREAQARTHGGKNPMTTLTLRTASEQHELQGPAGKLLDLVATAEHVAAANSAEFAEAGDEPIPDTALSPARLTGDERADRGLSRTDTD